MHVHWIDLLGAFRADRLMEILQCRAAASEVRFLAPAAGCEQVACIHRMDIVADGISGVVVCSVRDTCRRSYPALTSTIGL